MYTHLLAIGIRHQHTYCKKLPGNYREVRQGRMEIEWGCARPYRCMLLAWHMLLLLLQLIQFEPGHMHNPY